MKCIIFLRHGEYREVNLTETGRDQSKSVADKISAVLGNYGCLNGKVITSPILRAKETAEIIRDVLAGQNLNLSEVEENEGVILDSSIPILETGVFSDLESDFIVVVTHQPNIKGYALELSNQDCSPYYASGFCVTADSWADIQNKKGMFMGIAYNQSSDPAQSTSPLQSGEDKPPAKGSITPHANQEFSSNRQVVLFLTTPAQMDYNSLDNGQATYLADAMRADIEKFLGQGPKNIRMMIWSGNANDASLKTGDIIRSELNIDDQSVYCVRNYTDAMDEFYGLLGYGKGNFLKRQDKQGTDVVIAVVQQDQYMDAVSVFMGYTGGGLYPAWGIKIIAPSFSQMGLQNEDARDFGTLTPLSF